MPRWEPEANIDGVDVEDRRYGYVEELPEEAIILPNGDVLVPAEDHEAEYMEGEDGFIYSVSTGKPIAEIDDSDNDVGYNTKEEFDYDDDDTSDEDEYDEDEYDEYDDDEDE